MLYIYTSAYFTVISTLFTRSIKRNFNKYNAINLIYSYGLA